MDKELKIATKHIVSDDYKKYWLGLKMIPFLRSRIYGLTERAGGPKELWEANINGLKEIGLEENIAFEISNSRNLLDLDLEYEKLIKDGINIITDSDEIYPKLLREAPGYPRAIFVRGVLKHYQAAVAIVGARRSTTYGTSFAHELASDISKAGVTVVSGAARGIDTAAHRGTIEANGLTYAVLGCGLDIVYPPENRRLFEDIEACGALVSEYPPGTPPLAHNFPARNRIVAGMCQGVIVVEAGEKSGALITADFALDYGREVFAVPGHNKSRMSRGTNKLIKQGAYLVETASDVLDVLGIEQRVCSQADRLTKLERDFLEEIGWEARRLDEIVNVTGGSIASVSSLLVMLEITGFIKKDMAGNYIRVR